MTKQMEYNSVKSFQGDSTFSQCPQCSAEAGYPCLSKDGYRTPKAHRHREYAFQFEFLTEDMVWRITPMMGKQMLNWPIDTQLLCRRATSENDIKVVEVFGTQEKVDTVMKRIWLEFMGFAKYAK